MQQSVTSLARVQSPVAFRVACGHVGEVVFGKGQLGEAKVSVVCLRTVIDTEAVVAPVFCQHAYLKCAVQHEQRAVGLALGLLRTHPHLDGHLLIAVQQAGILG